MGNAAVPRIATVLAALSLGVVVGAVLGLTGAGGGILAVPALVVGLGWSMQQAAPVALIAVAGGAAVGAIEGFRRRLVRYRAAILMAATGIPVTFIGIRLAHSVSQRVLLAVFAVVMLVVGARLLWQSSRPSSPSAQSDHVVGHVDLATGRLVWNASTALLLTGVGALTGLMTGLLGVGGGFVIVPLLRRFTDITMHGIVATSLLVIAIVGIGGVFSAVLSGATLPLETTFLFSASTAAGMLVGRLASRRLSAEQVQLGFAAVVLAVAVELAVKAATL